MIIHSFINSYACINVASHIVDNIPKEVFCK